MESDTPEFQPDPEGAWRLTWFSKILILMVLAGPAVYVWSGMIQPEHPAPGGAVEDPGIQAKTDYRVTPLYNQDYYYTLRRLFRAAKERIIVAQFVIKAPSLGNVNWPDWRNDRVKKLLEALYEAHERGVNVTVVLSKPSGNETDEKNRANAAAKQWLEAREIPVGYNRSPVKLHDKVVMVDHRWVVQGSHNWTLGPMTTNVEASLLMEATDGEQWTWEDYHEQLSIGINETEDDGGAD